MLKFLAQRLTSRELEVLVLVASGASAKEIARQLKITSRTVETHINHLKLKTRSRNRAHLVAMALEEELIDNPCHMLTSLQNAGIPNAGPMADFARRAKDGMMLKDHAEGQDDMLHSEQI